MNTEFTFEKKNNYKYKIINILPSLIFIKDMQLENFKHHDGDGFIIYELWLDWIIWQTGVKITFNKK